MVTPQQRQLGAEYDRGGREGTTALDPYHLLPVSGHLILFIFFTTHGVL
jgi:hypothetical protein